MIIQNEPVSEGARADMSFTVPRDDLRAAREALEALVAELGVGGVEADEAMGKVSIVGAGMKTHPGVAAKVFTVLGEQGINIEMISTSPIKISCVVAADRVARRRARAARGVRAAGRRHDPARAAVRGVRVMRVAVVGATGAVGQIMLRTLERARLRGRGDRPVRQRALGRARSSTATASSSR